jgi:glycosyltransferase involved in cell wall biosynthesis
MRIVIALVSSSGQISGVERHALNLAWCLLTRPEIAEVHLVVAPWQQSFVADAGLANNPRLRRHAVPISNSALSRNLWFYAGLPSLAAELGADLVHLAYPAPLRRRAFACPVVATLHDLYPYDIPENFGFPKVFFNRAVLRQCLAQADAVACVSASTLARLRGLDKRLAQKKARILYNAVQPQTLPTREVPLPNLDPEHPFLLCVAQHRRNKNILLVLRAFERLLQRGHVSRHTKLLIVGIPGPETPAIESFIAAHSLAQHVILLNGIPETQLQWCYRHCGALLAPSIIEGFGLPIAEGLIAGCRIVCSDIPAFRELATDSCHFVTLGSGEEENFAAAICAALMQPRPDPIDLPQFAADAIAASCLDLYRSASPFTSRNDVPLRSPFQPTKERQSVYDQRT